MLLKLHLNTCRWHIHLLAGERILAEVEGECEGVFAFGGTFDEIEYRLFLEQRHAFEIRNNHYRIYWIRSEIFFFSNTFLYPSLIKE